MFRKTIEAVKAAEKAAQEELDALFVPYDPATGGGGTHWHAAGSGILTSAVHGLAGLREDLEKRQANIDDAEAAEKAAQERAAAAQPPAEPPPVTSGAAELAEAEGVDLTQIKGSGEGGKITKADVEAALPPNATDTAIAHAAEVGVDLRTVKGTGVDGRITKADVEAAVAAKEGAHA